jgi:hypothetical protein
VPGTIRPPPAKAGLETTGHADARSLAFVVAIVEVGVTARDAGIVLVVARARTVDVRVVALLVADVDIDVVAAIVVLGAIVIIGLAGVDGASARGGTERATAVPQRARAIDRPAAS